MARVFVQTKAVHSGNRRYRILNHAVPLFLFFSFLLLCLGQYAYSADVKLAWDPNKEPDVAGYEIHYGNASGDYLSSVDVGNVTTCTIPGLTEGETHYFAAKAYNAAGLESGFSNEITYAPPVSCTYSISPASQSFSASGGTGSVAVTTQGSCNWSASTTAAWISIVSGTTGIGSGTVSYSVAANTGTAQRTAAMTIAGRIFTISQAGIPTYTMSAAAGSGGMISPSGSVSVTDGSRETFTISPNAGYEIADVKVDGTSVGAVSSYTFSNVKADHNITATFAALATTTNVGFIIRATAGPGGNIYQSGNIFVKPGTSKTFYIMPNLGYVIADVKVDGVSIGKVRYFVFRYVTANHTIDASFSAAQ